MRSIYDYSFFMITCISPHNVRYCSKEEFSFLRYTLKLTHFIRFLSYVIHISSGRASLKLLLHIFIVSILYNTFFTYVSNLSIYSIGYNGKVWIICFPFYIFAIFIFYKFVFTLLKYLLKRFSLSF
jgi:hypothetical protein|nr:MAG TPA: hypothetical protein [Bacteriophage sp.]